MSMRSFLLACLSLALLSVPVSALAWDLKIKEVKYNGVKLTLVAVATSGSGDGTAWIGLTACDSDKEFEDEGFQAVYDFKAQRLKPSGEQEVTFTATVGPNADAYIAGIWSKKIGKCPRDPRRPGCKKWGYVLSDELVTIPSSVYWMYPQGKPLNAEEAFWEVRLMAAGADEQDLGKVRGLVETFAKGKKRAGAAKLAFRVSDGPQAKNKRDMVQVMYRYKTDEGDADALARALLDLGKVEVKHWPNAPAPLLVAVPNL